MTSNSSARPTNCTPQHYVRRNMPRPNPNRALRILAGAVVFTLGAHHAFVQAQGPGQYPSQYPGQRPSALPNTAPTAPSAPSAPTPQPSTTPAPSQTETSPSRADVTYGAGQLSVKANNASLNQVLREISRQTGMKITGGVAEERVFGDYGPASPAKVLSALLDGTSSNVLLIQSAANHGDGLPVELVLTPRHGGPTPPNPNAPSFDQGSDASRSEPFRPAPPNGASVTPSQQPPPPPGAPADPNQVTQPGPSTNSAPSDGTQRSPNDVKTPQQIYEQLMRLRQQPATPPTQ